jgi:YlmC/YmxH family sporulation protein
MIRFSELSCKDVINVRDGSRLGHIQDLEINACSGEICAVMVPEPGKLFGFFGTQSEYWIEWKQICKIGEDIILVDVDPSRCLRECHD